MCSAAAEQFTVYKKKRLIKPGAMLNQNHLVLQMVTPYSFGSGIYREADRLVHHNFGYLSRGIAAIAVG
jgi:hypothetical protein